MNEEILKKINFEDTINKSLQCITEAFVSFYGESERERIKKKFKNMLVIGYCKPEDFYMMIEDTEHLKLNELIAKLIEKINIKNISKQTLKNILLDEISKSDYISSLESYIDYINGNKDRLNDVLIFLNKLYKDITIDNIDILIKNNHFKEIDNIIPLYKEITKVFKKYILSTKEYKIYLKKCQNLRESLSKKYLKKIIKDLKEKLPEEEYLKIEEEYNDIINSYDDPNIICKEIYLNKLLLPPPVEAFTKETTKIMNSKDDYRKEDIQKQRIQYFKKIGINLGDNYEEYINNPKVIKLIPNEETVEQLFRIRRKRYIEMRDEYYKSLPEYQKNREKINSLELLDKDDGYDVYAYENEETMIIPNIKRVDNSYIMYTLVLIYLGDDYEYIDSCIIHELNHVLETYLIDFDGNNYKMTTGWEIFTGDIEELPSINQTILNVDEPIRKYELFDETINELISQDITKILFNNNNYIFNNKDSAQYKETNYELTRFLVEDFYETYKKEIIASRNNGNIHIIYETVGKDNFAALNELFIIYHNNFPEDTIFAVYDDKEKGIETTKTKIYDELCIKRDKILSDMNKYHKRKIKKLSV